MSTEEEKNDDFLEALSNSEMPELSTPKKKVKSSAEIERENMQQRIKEKQLEENSKKTTSKKKTSKKEETNFDDVKPKVKKNTYGLVPRGSNDTDIVEVADQTAKTINNEEIKKASEPTIPEPKEDNNGSPEQITTSPTSVFEKIDVLSSEERAAVESKKNVKESNVKKDVEISDDLDKKFVEVNDKIDNQTYETYKNDEKPYTVDEITKTISDNYEDEDNNESELNVNVELTTLSDEKEDEEKPKEKPVKKTVKKEIKTPFYGGDGETSSFKIRTSKIAKILRNVNIEDTEQLDPVDISRKTPTERQDFYLKSIIPTLQPTMSVVPLIISGVVISMTAFGWPDVQAILEYEDKLNDLDPSTMRDDEYIHAKNQLFIEKRRKQCDLFYKHINSVTGYVVKPSKEELFGKIIKFPDFPQLFFAAYAASFPKPYDFNIGCHICGNENLRKLVPKDLCFLLNSNIDIKRLNYFIQNGTALGQDETSKIYNEFQKEKIVEFSSKKYRIKKNLPISSFVYELSIPTIYEALDTMDEIIEVFRDVELAHTEVYKDASGEIINASTVYIDSSFGLTPELIEMRKYLYINSLIVPEVIEENKESKSAKIGFSSINDKPAIIQSIYNLSIDDYRTLINDENLTKIISVSGIRHAIKGGNCDEPSCGADLGFISAEPETLFFILARQGSKH